MTAAVATSSWPAARSVGGYQVAASCTTAVADAVIQVRQRFTEPVYAWPDGSGGAFVVIDQVDLGPAWVEPVSWLGFVITHLHPLSDVYPHWVRPDLRRIDGLPLAVPPLHSGNQFDGRPAVMVSRASRRRDPGVDTPARKAGSVLAYLRGQ